MLSSSITLLLPLWASFASADLLGPRYPAPFDLTSSNSLVAAAWQNLTNTFNAHTNGSAPSPLFAGIENLTFSTGVLSIYDPRAQSLQYHYASPEVATSTMGLNYVDGNSIYRVASVTKLFTVLAGMLSLTDEEWNRPFTQIFPSLTAYMQSGQNNWATKIQWDQVTPWSLAAQLSGVAADASVFSPNDLNINYYVSLSANVTTAVDPSTYGLPPSSILDLASLSCQSANASCTADKYFFDASKNAPAHLPWSTAGYSNNAFILLGLALANLTGKNLPDLYNETTFQPLGLNETYLTPPLDQANRSVLPSNTSELFFLDQGISISSGGIFSTINDLAKFSTGVLNSTLMPANKTRRWMKPISNTASLQYSVGAPWEILRYVMPAGSGSARVVVDLYTKLGDSGAYGGVTVLIPEYGAGFNLACGSYALQWSQWEQAAIDGVIRYSLPALEAQAQAAKEGEMNFADTYVSTNGINPTMTLAYDASVPRLKITQWMNNNTDLLDYTLPLYNSASSDGLRIVPTIAEPGSSQYAFRVQPVDNKIADAQAMAVGPLAAAEVANSNWLLTDAITYLLQPLDLFVFDVNGAGNATAVNILAFESVLTRQ